MTTNMVETKEDPRDAEITRLREQVAQLARMVAVMTQPKAVSWVALPSGQCIPASLVMAGQAEREAAGMRWDGNTPVFPPEWPRTAPSRAPGSRKEDAGP